MIHESMTRVSNGPMKKLTPSELAHYKQNGYVAPIRAFSETDAAILCRHLEAAESKYGYGFLKQVRHNHLLFPWLDQLIRHPAILDAVEDVLGPNILCWASNFFVKEPENPDYVSWHQDSLYWGLDPSDVVTAWVALSESTAENGAMRVIPGTHQQDFPHQTKPSENNLLVFGQEVAVEVDESRAVTCELKPGEMSLHHVKLVHGSDPNPSRKRRIGYVIRYLPTYVRQVGGSKDKAMLVRGVDHCNNFEPDRRPLGEMEPDEVTYHNQSAGGGKLLPPEVVAKILGAKKGAPHVA
jgi:non-haem Fe2+, alpha-ketoglutarate-dependent halogenase